MRQIIKDTELDFTFSYYDLTTIKPTRLLYRATMKAGKIQNINNNKNNNCVKAWECHQTAETEGTRLLERRGAWEGVYP